MNSENTLLLKMRCPVFSELDSTKMVGTYVSTTSTAPAAAVSQTYRRRRRRAPEPRRPPADAGRRPVGASIIDTERTRVTLGQYLLRSTWLVLAHCCALLVSSDCHWLANDE